ncbi:hypothetical protein SAMN04488543_2717 [Friedmanniella luteola]|uniref:Magnesium transporter NIPA n=1 Tax=Friedmanniella luteola TaxID=546871 RepID=A0A1H1WF52_9ACTN|nr:hypothetical protein [Friedmanniella luteola]SDS95665.1 hypothetical protein SAMN04488543_2717 [Friedmanniella luteola]
MSRAHVGAVLLAALGATLFGLAAVRQHGAVRAGADHADGSAGDRTLGPAALGRVLRDRSWLLGAAQATLAGGSHLVALALAPIALVQPIGVLAVPVTLVGDALRTGRRPARRQLLGALLSVGAVAALTLVLLGPAARGVQLPARGLLLGVVVAAPAAALVLLRGSRGWPDPVRCVVLSTAAAVLFGLNSVLLRTVGHLVVGGSPTAHLPLLVTAATGIALALPTGLWAMQTAYTAGAPQVVVCCLTLLDPVTAVLGGGALLSDGVDLTGAGWVEAVGCGVLATAGVLLLVRTRPSAAASGPGRTTGSRLRRRRRRRAGSRAPGRCGGC